MTTEKEDETTTGLLVEALSTAFDTFTTTLGKPIPAEVFVNALASFVGGTVASVNEDSVAEGAYMLADIHCRAMDILTADEEDETEEPS